GASEEAVADAGDESRAGRSRRRRGRRGGAHRDASRAGAIENGEGEISDEPRETAEDVAGPDESTTAAEIAAADDDVVQAAVETTPPASVPTAAEELPAPVRHADVGHDEAPARVIPESLRKPAEET